MDTVSPFVGPKLKAYWGMERAQELSRALDQFIATKPYEAGEGPRGGLTVSFVGQFPNQIPLTLGDAVHNLRTALDLLACDLVVMNGNSPKGVYFPFAESAAELQNMIVRRNFDRASPEALALLGTFQPFKGGNAMLRALHDLDIMDKHQLIIPVQHANRITRMSSKNPAIAASVQAVIGRDCDVSIGTGGEIWFGGGIPEVEMEISVMFGDNAPLPLRGRPVLKTLEDFAQLVLGIIEAFETLALGRRAQSISSPGQQYGFGSGFSFK